MKGSVTVIVRNAKTKYEFTIKRNITVIKGNSATGKTTLIDMIREHNLIEQFPNIAVYLSESFEWIILMSGCVSDKVVQSMSNNWGKYIESKQYFSWEQFFTDLLISKTHGTYLQYSKKNINQAFLKGLLRQKILKQMEKIDFR